MHEALNDRLGQLLANHPVLYGIICRDATRTDIELYAQAGYQIVWLDLEHSHQSTSEAIELCRTISHLGMVPLVRIIELSRTHVQRLLDGGVQVIALPDTRGAEQAQRLVQLGKFPPLGERGVASSVAGTGFHLGKDPQATLARANHSVHLMAMIESDVAFERLDEILAVESVDLVAVGPADWGASLGLFGERAQRHLSPKIERVLQAASTAGKIIGWGVSDPAQANRYRALGMRLMFLGPDVALKRSMFIERLDRFRDHLNDR